MLTTSCTVSKGRKTSSQNAYSACSLRTYFSMCAVYDYFQRPHLYTCKLMMIILDLATVCVLMSIIVMKVLLYVCYLHKLCIIHIETMHLHCAQCSLLCKNYCPPAVYVYIQQVTTVGSNSLPLGRLLYSRALWRLMFYGVVFLVLYVCVIL